jgi:large subunit ribosomal protein L1
MSTEVIVEAVKKAKAESKKRKFTQSIDLAISLRDVNLKDPSKRFKAEVLLPHNAGKDIQICVIGDATIISQAEEAGITHTMNQGDVENLASDPKEAKSFISQIDYFLAIPQMMANVGKNLGRFLGPAGKMPAVLPPNTDLQSFITRYSRTCTVRLRQNPVIHCRIGTESMNDQELAANIRTVLNEIEHRMEQGVSNIHRTYVKTTMGPAVEIKS